MLDLDYEKVSNGGKPYDQFLGGIKSDKTKKNYCKDIQRFLDEIPDSIYLKVLKKKPKNTVESKAEFFIKICEKNNKIGSNVIGEYIKYHNKRAESKEISPNSVANYIKPIKVLLDTNEIPLHWKKLYHMYPRKVNSQDRAYTREEIQKMLEVSHDLTDKVILTMFSSAGFRLESWNYFTWKDVIFFKDENEQFKGASLLVYSGDPESYWTFITPEACRFLWLYRETWKKTIGEYPKPTDPLLRITSQITIKALRQNGVIKRVTNMAKEVGLRPPLPPGKKRHTVKLDHGFRKYFNTMMRRAKVDYLDKEDMMGHKVGLEKHYERYEESDFERFPEYQKAIPFLTISDDERKKIELQQNQEEISSLKIKTQEIDELKAKMDRIECELMIKEKYKIH